MERDNGRKGTAVTKPIELRAKKADLPEHRGSERRMFEKGVDLKEANAKNAKEANSSKENRGTVSTLSAARVRSKSAPKQEIAEQIGLRLRGIYNDVLMQPIPDRFLDLLRQLEAGGEPKPQTAAASKVTTPKKDVK